jgi:hypothetical protein
LRYVLTHYTNTGKIYSSKTYGINPKKVLKKLERDAGFSFLKNPEQAIDYINERDLEHTMAVHKFFEIGKTYSDEEIINKLKVLYSPQNLTLMKREEHQVKTSDEMSKHQILKEALGSKLKWDLREVTREDAISLVNQFHYSDVMPRATKIYLGGFIEGILVGIITFGWGVQPERTINRLFPALNKDDYFEIGKMCLDERMPRNSESQFISASFKYIREKYPSIKIIYTWSDGLLGKPGFVYQASNFLYGGSCWSKRYFTKEGYKIHPRSSRYLCEDNARNEGKESMTWLSKEYMKKKGIKLYKGLQFRYCYFLCSDKEKKELLQSSKYNWSSPYPKFEDLVWMKQKGHRFVLCKSPKYVKSLTAEETIALL